ncbi:MurR/RpiR family transcriptional regulator [Terribacillus saccharophilus]|uniref:DNA-binding transcriptional regulator, MurR/RpiR family, contains HTH and SIS domains n=1 Tax=Terribacillus saccharophilus TaxID=361277 RepID=A0AAX2EIL6_9BACI|nr:MurR/RpiR family transcriptional regulator [Terribacillus goriensis]MEC0282694.1 MurR/RpiR family transcriptional regulator [Terribacillus saccharophilus]MEC0291895.1 MurR/RpiR family transcriptional regulator [Terribacillus saccharophilus]SEN90003.1 DNA-binding transcriptional regulator, MurR/RpiR family, contains HTH and SIS domains [Terribacillus saccharophilus]
MTADQSSPLHSSLLHSLFSIINEGNVRDTNYVLAHYFLENYSELQHLNIFDVSTDCFVSRSSVRRFCKAIGYENFIDLKAEFFRYDEVYYKNIEYYKQPNYQQLLSFEINKMIQDMSIALNESVLQDLLERFQKSRNVIFMTPGAYGGLIKDFQEKLITHKRIIYLISEHYTENELIRNLDEKDLLITLSTSGVFAGQACSFTKGLKASKVLITGMENPQIESFYDKVYYLSAKRGEELNFPIYSKYGIHFMLDLLYSEYVKQNK